MSNLSQTAQAAQDAARQDTGEFGTQTHAESGIVDAPTAPRYVYGTPTGTHWVYLQCEDRPDIYVGPFTDEHRAEVCMNDSSLIQGLNEEGCVDCFTTTDQPPAEAEKLWLNDEDQRELTAILAVDDLDHTDGLLVPLGGYKGENGTQFTAEIDQVAQAIIRVEGDDADNPLFVTFPGDMITDDGSFENNQMPSIGFTRNGFTISHPLYIFELVEDSNLSHAADQASEIAAGLLRRRDELVADYNAKMAA